MKVEKTDAIAWWIRIEIDGKQYALQFIERCAYSELWECYDDFKLFVEETKQDYGNPENFDIDWKPVAFDESQETMPNFKNEDKVRQFIRNCIEFAQMQNL